MIQETTFVKKRFQKNSRKILNLKFRNSMNSEWQIDSQKLTNHDLYQEIQSLMSQTSNISSKCTKSQQCPISDHNQR